MSQRFSKAPADYWGIVDTAIAQDFDRLHSLRLQLYENQVAKAQAEALKGNKEPEPDGLFRSNELGSFGPEAEN